MTQKQAEKHKADKEAVKAKAELLPVTVGDTPLRSFKAPDYQWVLKKQRSTCFGSAKNIPGPTPAYWDKTIELIPEDIKSFVDKHVINILSKDEQGREFLQQLKDKANYHYEVEVPVEPTPTA